MSRSTEKATSVEPLTDEELDAGRKYHKPTGWVIGAKGVNCQLCATRWPCSPARFLATIDALKEELAEAERTLELVERLG